MFVCQQVFLAGEIQKQGDSEYSLISCVLAVHKRIDTGESPMLFLTSENSGNFTIQLLTEKAFNKLKWHRKATRAVLFPLLPCIPIKT